MLKTSLCLPDLPRRQELAIDLRCSVDATGDGRDAERWNRCRTNGQISAPYRPQLSISKGVSVRNMCPVTRGGVGDLVSVLKCIRIILPARPTLPQNCITLN